MRTIFDTDEVQNFVIRIDKLNASSQGLWGKMNAYQMVKYAILSEHMFLRDKSFDRLWIGRLWDTTNPTLRY